MYLALYAALCRRGGVLCSSLADVCGTVVQFFDDPMLLELARQDAELGLS